MSVDRIADLLLVATELATNTLNHARGACRLAFWYEEGHVVCEASDMGHWADPLAGRRPPAAGRPGPYGLFVVNAIAELDLSFTQVGDASLGCLKRLSNLKELYLVHSRVSASGVAEIHKALPGCAFRR